MHTRVNQHTTLGMARSVGRQVAGERCKYCGACVSTSAAPPWLQTRIQTSRTTNKWRAPRAAKSTRCQSNLARTLANAAAAAAAAAAAVMVTPEVAGMCKRNLPRLYNRVIPAAWSDAAFDKFLRSVVVPAAQSEGIPQRTLRSTMLRVERQQRDEDATARAAAPPERAQGPNSAAAYVSALACDKRTSSGVKRLAELAAPLEDIEARTGVPREVLVAIWGVESAYGGFTGQHYTCRALATLAYEAEREEDHVRAHFFTTELVAAMRLEVLGIVRNAAEDLMGSYSGAIGQPQFMPSNYFRFAQRYKDVEPNGNEMGSVEGIGAPVVVDDVQRNGPLLESARYQGWPDIWGNEEDTLMSIANFLVEHGWPTHSSSWRASAAVLGDAAARHCEPPWEAVRSSAAFKSVRRYNPSDRYAAAVLTLAHRISVGSER